jgi:integrative and conjugative element protein (TIGR02256 family)
VPSLRPTVRPTGVLLPTTLRDELIAERTKRLPKETGGYLLGRRRGRHIEITKATFQGFEDKATPVSFDRLDDRHARDAVAAWQADDELSAVVGDWHSHPFGGGDPSDTDRHAWRTLTKSERAPIAGLIVCDGAITLHLTLPKWASVAIRRLAMIEESEDALVFSTAPPGFPFF